MNFDSDIKEVYRSGQWAECPFNTVALHIHLEACPVGTVYLFRWVFVDGVEAFVFEEAPRVDLGPLWSFNDLIICLRLSISAESFEVFFFV